MSIAHVTVDRALNELSWRWIALMLTSRACRRCARRVSDLASRPDHPGNLAGTAVIFGAALAMILRESGRVAQVTQRPVSTPATPAGRIPAPSRVRHLRVHRADRRLRSLPVELARWSSGCGTATTRPSGGSIKEPFAVVATGVGKSAPLLFRTGASGSCVVQINGVIAAFVFASAALVAAQTPGGNPHRREDEEPGGLVARIDQGRPGAVPEELPLLSQRRRQGQRPDGARRHASVRPDRRQVGSRRRPTARSSWSSATAPARSST